jgi:hypothetical protein
MPIWEDQYSGKETDGKFGPDLFKNKTLELDFDQSLLVVHNALPNKVKDYQKCRLIIENDMMFVEASFAVGSTTYKTKFLLHSGYSGDLLLEDDFANTNKLGEKLSIIGEKEMKDSFGHILKTKKAILPQFSLGNETLVNVPVGFFEGALGRQKMSILGGDLLKRFNIIIDAKREFIYLKPNHNKDTPYSNV